MKGVHRGEIGIAAIGVALPARRIPTIDLATRLNVGTARREQRLGFRAIARKSDNERASDLALAAVRGPTAHGYSLDRIECLAVVSQNSEADEVLRHQASRYVVDLIGDALARHVSLSVRRLVRSGFGVGLSWASTVLSRVPWVQAR